MDTLQSAPTRVNAARYHTIDVHRAQAEAWPAAIPKLTQLEAIKAAQLLYDRFYSERFYREKYGMSRLAYFRKLGRKPPSKVMKTRTSSGNRINWVVRGVLVVNADKGWREFVHEYSHCFHRKLRPQDRPHSDNHVHLEKEMVDYVVRSGWLDGKLKPQPQVKKPDPVVEQHAKVLARLKAWETKAKRAATAIGKLKKEEAKLRRKVPLFTL